MNIKDYRKPTPVKWRIIGDSLLTIGSTITAYSIFLDDKTFAVISLICTVIGKIVTDLFKEKEDEDSCSNTCSNCTCSKSDTGPEITND